MEALNVGGMTMTKILSKNNCTGYYHSTNNKFKKEYMFLILFMIFIKIMSVGILKLFKLNLTK